MRRSRMGLAALGLFAAVATALGAEPMKGEVAYRVSIDSTLKTWADPSAPMTLRGLADFDYRLVRMGHRVEVAVDRMTMSASVDGREINDTKMSRRGIVIRQEGKTRTMDRDDGNPRLGLMLDQFEVPLAILALDPEGAEVGRDLKFDSGPLVEAKGVDNARIFHPKFPKAEAEWDAMSLMPLGKGRTARGTLHYVKRPGKAADGRVEVDVSGRLELVGELGTAKARRGDYTVKGSQTYDPSLGDWISGKLTVNMSYETVRPDGTTFYGRGSVVMTLVRLGAGGVKDRPKSSP